MAINLKLGMAWRWNSGSRPIACTGDTLIAAYFGFRRMSTARK